MPRTPLHITLITNKHAFLALAARAGMAVPAWDMSIGPEELGDIARHIGFPLMLKRAEGMAGAGVRYVASAEELSDANWSITPEQPLMVQQCIGGSLGSTEVLFCRGHPVAWINSYHREFWPTPLSASCVRELADVPEAEDLLNRIGALTGYHGFAGVDWLRDRNDGRLYLIELNPRPTPCYHLGPRVGVDFSAALRGLLAGHPGIQRPRPSKTCRALVHQFPQYCYRAIDDRMFHQLWKVAGDIPREDPRLVVALLRRVCTHFLPTSLRDTLRNLLRPDGPIQAGSGDGSRDGARR